MSSKERVDTALVSRGIISSARSRLVILRIGICTSKDGGIGQCTYRDLTKASIRSRAMDSLSIEVA